jgi:hypothetical protein
MAVGVVDPGPGSVVLRASTIVGPVGVPAVFDHTSAGALAQLAAMDSAGLGWARAVIDDVPQDPLSQLSGGQYPRRNVSASRISASEISCMISTERVSS